MRRVDCLGIVGKLPTPKGLRTFWDTGRRISAVEVAEAITLQHSYFLGVGEQKNTTNQLYDFATRIATKANVYPVGYAALADDGRILVTEPWFEEKIDIAE
jgi:hypothetical protein